MNKLILSGRTTKENELKVNSSGDKYYLRNSLAVDKDTKANDGSREVDFIDIVMYGKTAEYIAQYAPKGSLIEVCGKLNTRKYNNNQGVAVTAFDCSVESAKILLSNKKDEVAPYSTSASPQPCVQPFNVNDDDPPF